MNRLFPCALASTLLMIGGSFASAQDDKYKEKTKIESKDSSGEYKEDSKFKDKNGKLNGKSEIQSKDEDGTYKEKVKVKTKGKKVKTKVQTEEKQAN